jgi:hypothetical protein
VRRFPWTTWAVLAVGEVLVNVWLTLWIPGFAYQGLHWLGVQGQGLDWVFLVVIIVVGLATTAHMVRLVLARDQRSWAWRQLEQPNADRRPNAV